MPDGDEEPAEESETDDKEAAALHLGKDEVADNDELDASIFMGEESTAMGLGKGMR